MNDHNIMLIKVSQRLHSAERLQKVLTDYGCSIKTRLGLHEADDVCGTDGLIILQLVKGDSDLTDFQAKLNELDGVIAKLITF
ncbi:MAG: hypothetical protein ACOX1U_06410 [Saccharofermentanales bacterium]|jgi:hypothetical protein|nr:hypothetical protein [Clostridiaceae bacterium]